MPMGEYLVQPLYGNIRGWIPAIIDYVRCNDAKVTHAGPICLRKDTLGKPRSFQLASDAIAVSCFVQRSRPRQWGQIYGRSVHTHVCTYINNTAAHWFTFRCSLLCGFIALENSCGRKSCRLQLLSTGRMEKLN